jgi:hypothetical protein
MTPIALKTLLVCGLLAVTAAGCGDASETTAAPAAQRAATTTSVAESEYVAQLNKLCAELEPKILAVTGGHHLTYPIRVYNAERPKLNAIYETFDAQADAIPVAAADRSAADAFDAYRRLSDAIDGRLNAAAATGKQAKFDAVFDGRGQMLTAGSEVQDLTAAGIICNAR